MRSERLLLGVVAVVAACGGGSGDFVARPTFEGGGLLRDATPLTGRALAYLAGVHAVDAGNFGSEVVVRATEKSVSFFAEPEATWSTMAAGCLGDRLVLEGFYRRATTTETGLVRLFVGPETNARALCRGSAPPEPIVLEGTAGDAPLRLHWTRSTRDPDGRFFVVAHRGGCRTLDKCGASENSVEVLRLAESLGADAVEVDVRLTSDGVPILYHDDAFDPRLATGPYCHGDVADFTLAHVRALCKLSGGENVPTLDEALAAVVEDTTLRGVWLDVKSVAALQPTRTIAEKWARAGRSVQLVVGLSTEELLDAWRALGPAEGITCLSELDPTDLCRVWGPRWTRGPMESDVRAVQARGGQVAYWTLDEREFIDAFLAARPDAILTNRPGLVRLRFEQIGGVP